MTMLLMLWALHGHWIDHYKTVEGLSCCSARDCRPAVVAVLDRDEVSTRVVVDGVVVTLPTGNVHWSEDTQGWACVVLRDNPSAAHTIRCVFVVVGG